MAHNVETMAWTNKVPWHGLGVKVDDNLSASEMLVAAGLDWTVSRRKVYYGEAAGATVTSEARDEVNDFFAVVRDTDGKVMDVVGNRYLPTQNVEAFEFFNEFVHAGQAKMDTAGSLRSGRIVWGLASLGEGFTLAGKDRVNGYLLLSLPHEQGKSIQAKFTSVRVVCNNTLTMALRGKSEFRMSHRMLFDKVAQENAKRSLGIAREQLQEQHVAAVTMSKATLTANDSTMFLATLLDPTLAAEGVQRVVDDLAQGKANKRLTIAHAALSNAPGQLLTSAKGTVWGALNALTYSVDHAFGRGADQRLTKAWYGNGASLKQKAFAAAMKIAS